jgi:hypothetical protein
MSRRTLLVALAATSAAVVAGGAGGGAGQARLSGAALVEALRGGGYVLYFRHAATDFSQEDTDTRDLRNCRTQRNLNAKGRADARAVGRAVREQTPDRLGEDLLGERGPALLVEDDVALRMAEGIEQLEVAVDDAAQRRQRELEPLERGARSGQGRPERLAVLTLELLRQRREQDVARNAAPMQGHSRHTGLVGEPLKRRTLPTMSLERPAGAVEQLRIELGHLLQQRNRSVT